MCVELLLGAGQTRELPAEGAERIDTRVLVDLAVRVDSGPEREKARK
jgi:hypothetical protein